MSPTRDRRPESRGASWPDTTVGGGPPSRGETHPGPGFTTGNFPCWFAGRLISRPGRAEAPYRAIMRTRPKLESLESRALLHASGGLVAGTAVLGALDRLPTGTILDVNNLSKSSVTRAIKNHHSGGKFDHSLVMPMSSTRPSHADTSSETLAEFGLPDGRTVTILAKASKSAKMRVVVGPQGPAGPQGPSGCERGGRESRRDGPGGSRLGSRGRRGYKGLPARPGPGRVPRHSNHAYNATDNNTIAVPSDGTIHFVSHPSGAQVTVTLTAGQQIYVSAEADLAIACQYDRRIRDRQSRTSPIGPRSAPSLTRTAAMSPRPSPATSSPRRAPPRSSPPARGPGPWASPRRFRRSPPSTPSTAENIPTSRLSC